MFKIILVALLLSIAYFIAKSIQSKKNIDITEIVKYVIDSIINFGNFILISIPLGFPSAIAAILMLTLMRLSGEFDRIHRIYGESKWSDVKRLFNES